MFRLDISPSACRPNLKYKKYTADHPWVKSGATSRTKKPASQFPKFIEVNEQLVCALNDLYADLELPIRAVYNGGDYLRGAQIEIAKRLEKRNHDVRMFHDTTLKAACNVVRALFETSRPHVGITADPQAGKTGVLTSSAMILNSIARHDGPEAVVSPHMTNDSAMEFRRDIAELITLYGSIECVYEDQDGIPYSFSTFAPKVVKRTAKKWMIDEALTRKSWGEKNIVVIVDETDHGCAEGSILHRTLEDIKSLKMNVNVIACSATGEEYEACDDFDVIELEPGPGYRGLHTDLSVKRISDFAKNFVLDSAKDLTKVSCMDAIANMVWELHSKGLTGGQGLTGKPMNGGRGVLVRYGAGETATRFIDQMTIHADKMNKKRKPGVKKLKVIRYTGPMLKSSIREVIDQLGADENAVLVVTGSCRRSVRVPQDVPVFIDCTYQYTTHNAAHQGAQGRMSGYKKNTVVFLTDACHEAAMETRRKGRPHLRVSRATTGFRKSEVSYVTIDLLKKVVRIGEKGPSAPLPADVIKAVREGITKTTTWRIDYRQIGKKFMLMPKSLNEMNDEVRPGVRIVEKGQYPDIKMRKYIVCKDTLYGGMIDRIIAAAQPLFSSTITPSQWHHGPKGYVKTSLSAYDVAKARGSAGHGQVQERPDHSRGWCNNEARPEIAYRIKPVKNGYAYEPVSINLFLCSVGLLDLTHVPTEDSMFHDNNRVKFKTFI